MKASISLITAAFGIALGTGVQQPPERRGVTVDPSLGDGAYRWDPQKRSFIPLDNFAGRTDDVTTLVARAEPLAAAFVPPPPKPDRSSGRDKEITPVPVKDIKCPERPYDVNPHEYDAALKRLGYYCTYYTVPPMAFVVFIEGNTIVYTCNQHGNSYKSCSLAEFLDIESKNEKNLNEKCGRWSAGVARSRKWKKWYGRDIVGAIICEEPFTQLVGKWKTVYSDTG